MQLDGSCRVVVVFTDAMLTLIRELDVSYNALLSGSIPEAIGNLTALT
jgi:hypothetical protein